MDQFMTPILRQMPSIAELTRYLDRLGFHVIPKDRIVRLGAEYPVNELREGADPDFLEFVSLTLGASIGKELAPILSIKRVEEKSEFISGRYRTTIEVIKP